MIPIEHIINLEACKKCPLNTKETKVPWEINNKLATEFETIEDLEKAIRACDIAFVGEAPGHMEEKVGKPFVHKAGKLLRNTIQKILESKKELKFINIMITNACKCKPTDPKNNIRPPKIDEIKTCRANLINELRLAKPHLIVALGKTAAIALEVPGASRKLEDIRGQFFDTKYGKVFVTYHPSAILRNNLRNIKTFEHDLMLAFSHVLNCENKIKNKDNKKENQYVSKAETKVAVNTDHSAEYEIKAKVVYTNKELEEEFEQFEKARERAISSGKYFITSIDFETIPFHWDYLPQMDAYLRELPLSPYYGDIAFASIAYCEYFQSTGRKIIRSFSFPVKACSMIENILQTTTQKVEKLENEKDTIVDNLYEILSDKSRKSKILSLYFLYKEFGFSREHIEKIVETFQRSQSKILLKRILSETIATYKNFLTAVENFKKDIQSRFSIHEEIALSILRKYFESNTEKVIKVAQNPQFEYVFAKKRLRVEPTGLRGTDILDHLLGFDKHGLSELEKRYIHPLISKNLVAGYTDKKESQVKGKSSVEKFALYNAEDSAKTLLIYLEENKAASRFQNVTLGNSYREEIKLTDAIRAGNEFVCSVVVPFAANAHLEGVKINVRKCTELAEKVHTILENLLDRIKSTVGDVNIRADEFREKLYQLYEGEPIYTSKGEKYSTSESALKHIYKTTRNENLKRIVLYFHSTKKYEGLLSRYIEKYPFHVNKVTKRIHPWYDVIGTVSGRLSCKDPNIQQVPREPFTSCPDCFVVPLSGESNCPLCGKKTEVLIDFREVFEPEDGNHLIMADYSQIEMVVLAELSKDQNLIKAINKGLDMHSYNASNVYGIPYEVIVANKDTDEKIKSLRQNAKRVTFAVIYGASETGIAKRENISEEEARRIIDAFYEKHPDTRKWIDKRHREAVEKGVVLVPTGRPRWFAKSEDKAIVEATKRRAQNTPIQGFASDLNILTCEILRRKYGTRIIGAIHDSILAEERKEKVEKFLQNFWSAVEETRKIKSSLKEIFGLRYTPHILEDLSVNLKAEVRYGSTWKEVK